MRSEHVLEYARSGDRAYRTADLRPLPVGRVPSRGDSKDF